MAAMMLTYVDFHTADVSVLLRPYKQSFPELSTSSNWHHAARGSILDGDIKDGIFYGVGTDSWKQLGVNGVKGVNWTVFGRYTYIDIVD